MTTNHPTTHEPSVTREAGVSVLRMTQTLPLPPEELFPFFADAFNLQRITPPFLKFRVLTPGPIDMKVGALIEYQIRLHGIPIRWRTEITGWDPPTSFRDEQRKGPYKLWRHTHTFTPTDDGGTLCEDRVDYAVPGGPLSPLVERLFVRGDVLKIFRYRAEQLDAIFGGGSTAESAKPSASAPTSSSDRSEPVGSAPAPISVGAAS